MNKRHQKDFGETTLGEVFLYVKSHVINLLKKWWILLIGGIVFGVLAYLYAINQDDDYIAYASFSAESGKGSSGMMASAMELAGKFGISSGGGSEGLTVEYLLGIAKSHRIIKSSMLHKESINGQEDILANHFMRMYEFYEEELAPPEFVFENTQLSDLTTLEDSIMRMIYKRISSDHFSAELPEGQNVNVVKITSKNKEFSLRLCENLVTETENFFILNRVKQDRETVKIVQARADSIAERLFKKEYDLASWRDSRNRVVKAKGYLRELQLMREVEMLNMMYGEIIANLEAAKFSLLQNTPIFALIDEPHFSMSVDRMKPKLLAIVGFVIGGMMIAFFIIVWKVFKDAVASEKEVQHEQFVVQD